MEGNAIMQQHLWQLSGGYLHIPAVTCLFCCLTVTIWTLGVERSNSLQFKPHPLHREMMATRIVVKCKSHNVPDPSELRPQKMADMVCRHICDRGFDVNQDQVHSLGQFDRDGVRCFFLVDVGPPDSQEIKTSMYNWDGSRFTELPVSPIVKAHLQHYSFNPANKKPGYSDEEYKEKYGKEEYEAMMAARITYKKEHGLKLFPTEEAFIQNCPGLVGDGL